MTTGAVLARPRRRIAAPGTAFLGTGIGIIGAIQMAYGFARFLAGLPEHPDPLVSGVAWALLFGVMTTTLVVVLTIGEHLSGWLFLVLAAALATAVAIDFAAVWPLGDVALHASASIAAGAVLLAMTTLRGTIEVASGQIALGSAMAAVGAITASGTPGSLVAQVSAVSITVLPGLIGVAVVHEYRRIIRIELDRTFAQAALAAPRFSMGMLASAELARLDRDAEQLLQDVASGAIPLPLRPELASRAASLSTELRLHLMEGRSETWLVHAVAESALLRRVVTIEDPESLAGLLRARQRDGLLSAIWQLASAIGRAEPRIRLALGPSGASTVYPDGALVPIVIEVEGLRRNRITPSVWEALGRIGSLRESVVRAASQLRITAHVDRVQEQ